MAWSVQGKRNLIGVVWMVGGMGLLAAAMLRSPVYLSALVGLAIILYIATLFITCPRCGQRVYAPGDPKRGHLLRRLPATCPHCGLGTRERPEGSGPQEPAR